MKYVILIFAFMYSLASHANIEERTSSGLYSDCARWTTLNGVEQSKEFRYTLNDDDTMSFEVLFYVGSSKCEGEGQSRFYTSDFTIMDKIVVGQEIYMLVAKDEQKKQYYQMMFDKGAVALDISDTFPIQVDLDRSFYLKRVQ